MDITDSRVVQFRQWAERRFGIGSGGYGDEDLLSIVMERVEDLILTIAYEHDGGNMRTSFEEFLSKADKELE